MGTRASRKAGGLHLAPALENLLLVPLSTLRRLERPFVPHPGGSRRLVALTEKELVRWVRGCPGVAHLVDPERTVRECSQGLSEFLGRPREKLIGRTINYHYGLATERMRHPPRGTPENVRVLLGVKADELVLQQEILEALTKLDVAAEFPDAQTFVYGGSGMREEWRGLREVWIRADRIQDSSSRRFAGRVVTATVTHAAVPDLEGNTLEGFLRRAARAFVRYPDLVTEIRGLVPEGLQVLLTDPSGKRTLLVDRTPHRIEQEHEAAIAEMNAFLRQGGGVREGAPTQDDNWNAYQRVVHDPALVSKNRGKFLLFVDGHVGSMADTRREIARLFKTTKGVRFVVELPDADSSREEVEVGNEGVEHEAAIAEMNAFLRQVESVREGAPSQDDNWNAYERLLRNTELATKNKGKYVLFVNGYVQAVARSRAEIGRLYLAAEGEAFMVGLADPDGPLRDVGE